MWLMPLSQSIRSESIKSESISSWVERHAGLLPSGGRILDLACGRGRHARFLAAHGFRVVAVDKDLSGVADLRQQEGIELIEADLETGAWPLAGSPFDGIVVVNYLHRPHFPFIVDTLAPGGVLIFDTFAAGNERWGKPRNPAFLLRPGEQRTVFKDYLKDVLLLKPGDGKRPLRAGEARYYWSWRA